VLGSPPFGRQLARCYRTLKFRLVVFEFKLKVDRCPIGEFLI
jgi:hypothetical protein